MNQNSWRIMRMKEVIERVGFSAMHLHRLEKVGKFPRRFKLASAAKSGAVAWWEHEVLAYLNARSEARTAAEVQAPSDKNGQAQ